MTDKLTERDKGILQRFVDAAETPQHEIAPDAEHLLPPLKKFAKKHPRERDAVKRMVDDVYEASDE